MTPEKFQRIDTERGSDFTAQVCPGARPSDLDDGAVALFVERWITKSKKETLLDVPTSQLLEDAELTVEGQITYAALILLGRSKALGRYLANAEIIFEYRAVEHQIPSSQRGEFRQGLLSIHDALWKQVNLRNDVTSIREGFFRRNIPAFDEEVFREAILNAVCHRDYQLGGSIFVHQSPLTLRITSPGGFPDGISPQNVLRCQAPRNRLLAEACSKCGLVERLGLGMDRIFGTMLREGKSRPDFDGTDAYQVVLTLRADKADQRFAKLLEVAFHQNIQLSVEHLVVLDMVRQQEKPSEGMNLLVQHLVNVGLIERHGYGKRGQLILSRDIHHTLGEAGTGTRHGRFE